MKWLKKLIREVIQEELVEVKNELEAVKNKPVPDLAYPIALCNLCGKGITEKQGQTIWQEAYYHSTCFDEFDKLRKENENRR